MTAPTVRGYRTSKGWMRQGHRIYIGKIFTAAALAAPPANLLKISRAAGVLKN